MSDGKRPSVSGQKCPCDPAAIGAVDPLCRVHGNRAAEISREHYVRGNPKRVKKSWETEEAARAAQNHDGTSMQVYECSVCRKWHSGHVSNKGS